MAARQRGKQFLILLILSLAAALVWLASFRARQPPASASNQTRALIHSELAAQLKALEQKENQFNHTLWAAERLAQKYGQLIDSLWDRLNRATNPLAMLASFPIREILVDNLKPAQKLPQGINRSEPGGALSIWTAQQWQQFLNQRQAEGWQLVQTEFRHNRFETNSAGLPERSAYYFSAHLENSSRAERAIVSGDLLIEWDALGGSESAPAIRRIDATRLSLLTRTGQPAFRRIFEEPIFPPEKSYFIDPLVLYDLDGDGFSEIILAAKNLVYRRRAPAGFQSEPLCRHSPGLIFTAVLADFDGNGTADFLCAKFEGLHLFAGSKSGGFDQPGRLVWSARPHLKYAQVLTSGDIDRDGDLDVWMGQYKVPYERGQMPGPYYDANDGHPAYLLLNDGNGSFTDATLSAGLGQKRWRRSYSGSFIDFDEDGDLDLMVVSDFAGLELYANNGEGQFADVTASWVMEPHAFGMAHAAADFNLDGRLDLLMIGMNSPTADRLEYLGLMRGPTPFERMRPLMTFGNRLYLAQSRPPFQQTALNQSIARSGWAWGCSAFDWDNDQFPDVYIANGHETRKSVQEYEPEFWLHDIYAATSMEHPVADVYFKSKFARTRAAGFSYGGYEKNRFYWNRRGLSFLEIGFLLDIALEQDSRGVVADDLDADGKMDLLVTTFQPWPEVEQGLRVFKNHTAEAGNWIGFRFREQGRHRSPLGARVSLRHAAGSTTRQIITGDSYRAQHANTVHFGLGELSKVESAEVRWPGGQTLVLRDPAINQYHHVSAPAPAAGSK